MKRVALEDYLKLRDGGELIERDRHGEKVVRRPDGTMLKLFRRKRLVSSALFYPYAQRFADNCERLRILGIPCPTAISVLRVPAIDRDLVHYHPLPGRTLRQLRPELDDDAARNLRRALGEFFARLHRLGVYFRSLHLGNVVLTPEGRLGLIDVADLAVRRGPLGASARRRNLRHLARYAEDHAWLHADDAYALAYAEGLRDPSPQG